MLRIKAVSGVMCVVEDLGKTIEFYERLGFDFQKKTEDYAIGYVNWFWVEFVPKDKVEKSSFEKEASLAVAQKGAGVFLHMSVDDVDECYHGLIDSGLKPASEP
jgi:hypothetical protein